MFRESLPLREDSVYTVHSLPISSDRHPLHLLHYTKALAKNKQYSRPSDTEAGALYTLWEMVSRCSTVSESERFSPGSSLDRSLTCAMPTSALSPSKMRATSSRVGPL